jgi:ABC-type multidrug transport system ATPase subunit
MARDMPLFTTLLFVRAAYVPHVPLENQWEFATRCNLLKRPHRNLRAETRSSFVGLRQKPARTIGDGQRKRFAIAK